MQDFYEVLRENSRTCAWCVYFSLSLSPHIWGGERREKISCACAGALKGRVCVREAGGFTAVTDR